MSNIDEKKFQINQDNNFEIYNDKNKEIKNLILFLIISFGWSYLFWGIEIIFKIRVFVAPFGPTLAAFFITFIREGKKGVLKLLKRGFSFNFNKIWLIPSLLLMPSIIGLSYFIAILSGEKLSVPLIFSQPLIVVPAFFYIFFLGGPLAEEFGWRGYALGKLQIKYNAFTSSLILGIIWGLWHLPLFFMEDQEIYKNIPFIGFMVGTILFSIIFTWIYNNTNSSIIPVLLLHTTGNFGHFIFPAFESKYAALYSLILNLIVDILILVFFGLKKMIKKK